MSKRQNRLNAAIGKFLDTYARKADHNHDPNDRQYSHKFARTVKRMHPQDLNDLMQGEDPSLISQSDLESWLSGEAAPGVKFVVCEEVELLSEDNERPSGKVVSVLQVHPVPKYVVEIEPKQFVEIYETKPTSIKKWPLDGEAHVALAPRVPHAAGTSRDPPEDGW